ncbi:hypothetical protein H2Y56_22050 [Pectobacterium aroidearum]|uniref:Uncharacterized protein n=1 Tax=Pectobacterium aroidearum TaxID=1201031 RepID=A0ABR5ZJV7_9GAMM|nr:hypothetical protein [Pectobacterium aroidearum]MBA5234767.1 hypothetical protein [Pectobacterium aroidearum]MBA5739946.1 hypothetical protein [Pectobacterium aroidearum]
MAIFRRISRQNILKMFTHTALFCGVIPVYINMKNPACPDVMARNGIPEWSLNTARWLVNVWQRMRLRFDHSYIPGTPFVLTGLLIDTPSSGFKTGGLAQDKAPDAGSVAAIVSEPSVSNPPSTLEVEVLADVLRSMNIHEAGPGSVDQAVKVAQAVRAAFAELNNPGLVHVPSKEFERLVKEMIRERFAQACRVGGELSKW